MAATFKEIEQIVHSGTMVSTDAVYDNNLKQTQEDINEKAINFVLNGADDITALKQKDKELLAEINAKNYAVGGAEYDTYPTQGSTKLVRSGGIYAYIVNNTLEYNCSRSNSGATYSLSEAIAVIPTNFMIPGIRISFINKVTDKYEIYQNTSPAYSSNVSAWMMVAGDDFNPNLEWKTTAAETRLQVPDSRRRVGLIISYLNRDTNALVAEQYNNDTISDDVWQQDLSWQPVNPQKIMDSLGSAATDYALSANQGRILANMLGDGYKYFGIARPATSPGGHQVFGFWLAYLDGEYTNFPNVDVVGTSIPITLAENEVAVIVTADYTNNLYRKFTIPLATKSQVDTIANTIANFESIKTRVLTEENFNALAGEAQLEADRFYFTFEEE